MTAGVDRSYAKALFSLAQELAQADAVGRGLDAAAALFANEPALRAVFGRPWITGAVKRNAAAEVAARLEGGPLLRDFLALVAARGRAEHLPGIAAAYRELVDDIVPGSVLRDELLKRLAYAQTKVHEFPPRRNAVYPV